MAFGNISTLYLPTAANAGASQWGTDVRKVLAAADTAADTPSKTDHSTGGAVTRTLDPYTTSTTDAIQADFGWAVTPADMNSVAGARRFYPAGNHVATVRMGHNGTTAATGTVTMFVYRVGPAAGRTRTLLASNTASVDFPAASGEVTMICTVSLAEVIFEVDETVQYSFELNLAGIAVVGRVARFFTGTQTAVEAKVNTPTLGVLADTTGTATGTGLGSGVTGKVLAALGSATGSGVATGTGGSRADTTGTAIGLGTGTGQGSSVAGTTGTSAGTCTVGGQVGAIGGMVGVAQGSGIASGQLGAIGGMIGSAAGIGTAVGELSARADMVGTAVGSGVASGQASSISGTIGTAVGLGIASGVVGAVIGTTGTVSIGAATPDWPLNAPTKAIAGVTRNSAGAIVVSATVLLVRDSDGVRVASTTSHPTTGAYSFTRGTDDPHTYRVVATKADAPEIHGVSDLLVPA